MTPNHAAILPISIPKVVALPYVTALTGWVLAGFFGAMIGIANVFTALELPVEVAVAILEPAALLGSFSALLVTMLVLLRRHRDVLGRWFRPTGPWWHLAAPVALGAATALLWNQVGLIKDPVVRQVWWPWLLVAQLATKALLVPIAEEMLHRGVIYGALRRRLSPRGAAIVSIAVFTSLHDGVWQNPLQTLIVAGVAGVATAMYLRTGSLVPAIVYHMSISCGVVLQM